MRPVFAPQLLRAGDFRSTLPVQPAGVPVTMGSPCFLSKISTVVELYLCSQRFLVRLTFPLGSVTEPNSNPPPWNRVRALSHTTSTLILATLNISNFHPSLTEMEIVSPVSVKPKLAGTAGGGAGWSSFWHEARKHAPMTSAKIYFFIFLILTLPSQ